MPRRQNASAFNLERMLTYRISMLYSLLYTGTTRQLTEHGLVTREWRVLALLGRHQSVSARDLVARSPMDKASVSRAVASLSTRRLIVSRSDPDDRRVQRLSLTPAGRKLYARIAPFSLERQRALLDALPPAERVAIFGTLDKLIARAQALLGEGRAGDAEDVAAPPDKRSARKR
jgi:DNA-binding MarR family transcriptional regulator